MNYLFDSQEDAPKLTPVELPGRASFDAFLALRAAWLAGDSLALEQIK